MRGDDDHSKNGTAARTAGIGFLSNANRLNVAITRARDICYIVGDAEVLGRADALWADLVGHCNSRHALFSLNALETVPSAAGGSGGESGSAGGWRGGGSRRGGSSAGSLRRILLPMARSTVPTSAVPGGMAPVVEIL